MSNLIYANLDENNICSGITEYEQAIDSPASNMLAIDSVDTSILGKKWNGSAWEEIAITAEEAREWRDMELLRTDSLMGLSDYPNTANLTTYRQKLRDWPSTGNFPATKPTLGS